MKYLLAIAYEDCRPYRRYFNNLNEIVEAIDRYFDFYFGKDDMPDLLNLDPKKGCYRVIEIDPNKCPDWMRLFPLDIPKPIDRLSNKKPTAEPSKRA